MIRARAELDLSPADGLRAGGLKLAVRIGISRAASPVKGAVVAHAESVQRYGFLAKSIRIRLRGYPGDRFVAVIGPSRKYVRTKGKFTRGKRKGQPRRIIPAKYAHLLEGGTSHAKARPWLAPAYAESAPRFMATAADEVRAEIERRLSKAR